MCGAEEYLNAHHLITRKWLKTSLDLNCGIVLCKACHDNTITAVHISPWVLENKLEAERPEQFKWFLSHRIEVNNDKQAAQNYKLKLDELLNEIEKLFPATLQRGDYFLYSESEENEIVHDFSDGGMTQSEVAKKWGCSSGCIKKMLKRNGICTQTPERMKKNKENVQKACSLSVVKIGDDDKPIEEYPSLSDAARKNGVVTGSIWNCLKGASKKSCGFKWKYKRDIIIKESNESEKTTAAA